MKSMCRLATRGKLQTKSKVIKYESQSQLVDQDDHKYGYVGSCVTLAYNGLLDSRVRESWAMKREGLSEKL